MRRRPRPLGHSITLFYSDVMTQATMKFRQAHEAYLALQSESQGAEDVDSKPATADYVLL